MMLNSKMARKKVDEQREKSRTNRQIKRMDNDD